VATVLVIGASKGIGLETVKTALEAGHTVRAMARAAGRILIRNPNLERSRATPSTTRRSRLRSGVSMRPCRHSASPLVRA
jgi:NAD(P)-dependent dehydrogenase (short-subunit alcohol dehydrogenase family)